MRRPALKWPSRDWWALARMLGWVNTRILLTLFFAIVVVPVGIVFRLLHRDLLDRRRTGSSWLVFSARRDRRHYERMF
jgi:hypothetical protein